MKKLLAAPALVLGVLALATTAAANHGHQGKNQPHPKKQPHPNKLRAVIHTTDGGCAGNTWANDTIVRTLKVHLNKDGSYRIREEDKGLFETLAGTSPGNCPANTSKHGSTVVAGKFGTFKGYLKGTVTGGTFNPDGSCTTPCTQSAFIAAFFGPTASYSCLTNSADCKFKYVYHARKDQGLLFRHWVDRGHGAGTFLKERFFGDIAST
jgi:hypothetical protein